MQSYTPPMYQQNIMLQKFWFGYTMENFSGALPPALPLWQWAYLVKS